MFRKHVTYWQKDNFYKSFKLMKLLVDAELLVRYSTGTLIFIWKSFNREIIFKWLPRWYSWNYAIVKSLLKKFCLISIMKKFGPKFSTSFKKIHSNFHSWKYTSFSSAIKELQNKIFKWCVWLFHNRKFCNQPIKPPEATLQKKTFLLSTKRRGATEMSN